MKHLAALIVLTLLACACIAVLTPPKHEMLIDVTVSKTSAPSQPAWRLFTTCPVERRNVPRLEERIS